MWRNTFFVVNTNLAKHFLSGEAAKSKCRRVRIEVTHSICSLRRSEEQTRRIVKGLPWRPEGPSCESRKQKGIPGSRQSKAMSGREDSQPPHTGSGAPSLSWVSFLPHRTFPSLKSINAARLDCLWFIELWWAVLEMTPLPTLWDLLNQACVVTLEGTGDCRMDPAWRNWRWMGQSKPSSNRAEQNTGSQDAEELQSG